MQEQRKSIPFSVKCYNTTYRDMTNERNDVIGYVLKGTGTIEVESGIIHLTAGDSYLLRANEQHKYSINFTELVVQEQMSFSGSIVAPTLEAYGFKQTTRFENVNICDYLRRIQDVVLSQPIDTNWVMDQCYIIFVELCQYIRQRLLFQREKTQDYRDVEILKEYMDAHLDERITLERCSEIAALSTSQLARRFRKVYGISPCRYLNEKRMEEAREMLSNTTLSIQKISEQVGFADQYYFSRYFKRKCGKSPKQYRNT